MCVWLFAETETALKVVVPVWFSGWLSSIALTVASPLPPQIWHRVAVATPGSFSASSCEGRTANSCWWSPKKWRLTKRGALTAEGCERPIRATAPGRHGRPQGNWESSHTANHADAPFANVRPPPLSALFFFLEGLGGRFVYTAIAGFDSGKICREAAAAGGRNQEPQSFTHNTDLYWKKN